MALEPKPINRVNQPYRIYKPLFLDEKQMKMDLDREFESVSQALIWVTDNMLLIVKSLNELRTIHSLPPIELNYPTVKN